MLKFFDSGFGELDRAQRVGPIRWSHFDLLAVHEGVMELVIAAETVETMVAGDAVLIYPDTLFEGRCQSACRISVQHFAVDSRRAWPGILTELHARRNGYARYRFTSPGPLDHDIERAIALAFERQTPRVHELRVAQMMLLLGELQGVRTNSQSQTDALWQPLLEWVGVHLHLSISLADMASVMGMSSSRFRALFREQFAISPGRYINQRKMAEAARLLRETRTPIKSVALSVGYSDVANFYRAFQKAMRLTPAQYRSRYRLSG